MSGYEIATIVVSILSILMSLLAVLVSLIPYRNKIHFRVSINPFDKKELQIKFLIINHSDKDFYISKLYAIKGIDIQIFNEKDYITKIKSNSSSTFSINFDSLKFDSFKLKDKLIKTGIKIPQSKFISFCVVDSVLKKRFYKMRYNDFLNITELFKLFEKARNKNLKEPDFERFAIELSYYIKKNKEK